MTKRSFVALAVLAATLIGCQVLDSSRLPASDISPVPPTATKIYNPTPLPRGQNGHLAYIGSDGNVYVTTADGQETIAITDDATAAPEHMGLSYHRISWSPDGRLAFAAVQRTGNAARSKLYVMEAPGEPVQVVGQSDEHFVIYISWSPMRCSGQPTCQRLAYLIEEDDSISLRVVELADNKVENRRVGTGRPFYFSWVPDGQRILWHTGGAQRHNSEAGIALYDLGRNQLERLPHPPGLFLAPAWSPQGERWLGVAADNATDRLQSFASNQPTTLTSANNTQLTFAWSPEGNRVAYAVGESSDDLVFGPIHIFDVNTGQSRQITEPSFRIVGFFWAPDGQRLAYLQKLAPDTNWWQWRVYDLVEDRDRGFEAFLASFQMQFMINSFNQYAQSHRLWSPDSRYLAYADRDSSRVERVWLVDTWADRGADPILISEGSIGIWSWN